MKNKIKILCIDPAFANVGWSIIENRKVILAGVIQTKPETKKTRVRVGDDDCRRISEIVYVLKNLILEHNISLIIAEQSYGAVSAKASKALHISKTIVQVLSDLFEIGVEWYNEKECKKMIPFQKKSYTKEDMLKFIKKEFPNFNGWTGKAIDEHIADSICLYLVARQKSSFLKSTLKIE